MNPYNFSLLCFGFCATLLALLIIFKRNDQISKRFLALSLFCTGWSLAIGINFSENVSDFWALFSSRLGNVFALFIPVSWYHFILTFVGKQNIFKRRIKFLYILVFTLSLFSFTPWFIPYVKWIVGFRCSSPGPLYHFSPFLFVSLVSLGFIELLRKIKITLGQERQQVVGLAVATAVGFLGGGLIYFPAYNIPVPQYGLFVMPFYALFLAYVMTKQKLFDIEELAQAAHRDKLIAIGVLAASINHEVRNPLYVIQGLAENFLERWKDAASLDKNPLLAKAADALERSKQQAERAIEIIKRLSLFAKTGIDSEIRFEPIKIASVVEDVLPLIRCELAARSIELACDIPSDLSEVRADRRYLEEILFNLVVNACQAIKNSQRPGRIEIRATTNAEKTFLIVKDDGPGIAADKLERIFHPFYTTKQEGTGLGLYITKQLVEKIGARIAVESQPEQGTIFTLEFKRLS